jgi:hypothetical protein
MDYFTKWVEVIPMRNETDVVVINFLEETILSIFNCHQKIVTDNEQAFKSMAMIKFCQKFNIILCHSTTYYPQGNSLAESSNKSLTTMIKKILTGNKKMWHIHLKYTLWANRISTKREIGMSPFHMVYGTNVILPINLSLPVMIILQDPNE